MIHVTIKAILFDKDGTLLDFEKTWGPTMVQVIDQLTEGDETKAQTIADSILFDRESQTFGPGSTFVVDGPQIFASAWAEILGRAPGDEFCQKIDEMFVAPSLEFATPFLTTRGTLRYLREHGFTLGIGTNDSEEGARAQADKLGFTKHMAFIAGHNSGHGAKPAPGMVFAFAETTGYAVNEIAMVGDSAHDMLTGQNAGATSIGVLTGQSSRDDLAPHADHILESIAELPALLKLF